MLGPATHLDHPVADTRFIVRQRSRRRTAQYLPGAHVEPGSVPWTHDSAAVDPAVGHRRGQMRAVFAKRRHLLITGAAYHQSDALNLDALRLSVLQRLQR